MKTEEKGEYLIIQEKIIKSNGDIITKNYKKGPLLGKGGFASVYEFTCLENKKLLAGKIIPKSLLKAQIQQKLMSEIKIHRSLHHPHIVAFEGFFEDSSNVYILLELCRNQTINDLMKRRKRLTEIEIQYYLHHLISALKYLHSNRIIHRDLKLGNLFLNTNMELKLGDFGLAAKLEFNGERKRTFCGTPNYIAPEILEAKEGHSYESDIWSLGALLYTLSIGRPPFDSYNLNMTYKNIKSNNYEFPKNVLLSEELKNLISNLLVLDPVQRLPLDDILQHPFMRKYIIPKNIPASTLVHPPSASYINKHTSDGPKVRRSNSMPMDFDKTSSFNLSRSIEKPARLSQDSSNKNSEVLHSSVGSSSNKKVLVSSKYLSDPNGVKIFIKKWVDYSSKYGVGYLLSDNSIGICFNDSSKLIYRPDGMIMHIFGGQNNEVVEYYSISCYPSEIKKKINLLDHFKKYLQTDLISSNSTSDVFLKKWLKTDHATIFRLSDKTIQVRFLDKTELLLSSELKTVVFLDQSGKSEISSLKSATQSENRELIKRLNYTTEMISRMMNQSLSN